MEHGDGEGDGDIDVGDYDQLGGDPRQQEEECG